MYEQTVAADNGDVLHYLERAEFKPCEHIWHPVVASLQGQVSMHVSTITTDRVSGGTITIEGKLLQEEPASTYEARFARTL